MIGHNKGPTLEGGTSWRRNCWQRARRSLVPTLPIEVVRLRVKRAKELGLDYTTYASVRAQTGHDVIALLFSSNALDMLRKQDAPAPARIAKLRSLQATGKGVLVRYADHAERLEDCAPGVIDFCAPAPRPFASWGESRQQVLEMIAKANWVSDRVVMIGETFEERDWSTAARLAGYVPAERFFVTAPG